MACPLCHTETGRQVHNAIFDGNFGTKVLLSAAPFPVFAVIIAVMYFGGPKREGNARE